jgi:hypothetical protein
VSSGATRTSDAERAATKKSKSFRNSDDIASDLRCGAEVRKVKNLSQLVLVSQIGAWFTDSSNDENEKLDFGAILLRY